MRSGDTVIYYDRWKGFEGSAEGLFEEISYAQAKKLKVGDFLWTDDEPYHQAGKVYGFSYHKIVKIEQVDGLLRFYFTEKSFSSIGKDIGGGNFYVCKSEKKLEELIENKKLILMHYNYD